MRNGFIAWILLGLVGCGDGSATGADAGSPDAATMAGPQVELDLGIVEGRTTAGMHVFYDIPYAAPPVGDRRWRPPAPAEAWDGVRDGSEPGARCVQGGSLLADSSLEEDCLRVNVWTPELSPASPLPVLVWIHGGGFRGGSGADELYDSRRLAAAGPVVVVTINYRLGVLGFLAHESLSAEQDGRSGNYGFLDQQEALRWVQRNVERFGGDASSVTIFGESAGGLSVCAHMAAPSSHGLFDAAISQSGLCYAYMEELAEGERLGQDAVDTLGCSGEDDVVACLRATSVEQILGVALRESAPGGSLLQERTMPYRMYVDGELFPETLQAAFEGGRIADVPFMSGANSDEGNLYTVAEDSGVETAEDYEATLARYWGPENGSAIVAHYRVEDYVDPAAALSRALTDGHFVCAARANGSRVSAAGGDAYLYLFTQEPSGNAFPGIGAFHGAELTFLFGNRRIILGRVGPQTALMEAMQRYWTRFAATGDPNGAADPTWTLHDATDPYLELGDPIGSSTGLRTGECDFWDGIYTGGRR